MKSSVFGILVLVLIFCMGCGNKKSKYENQNVQNASASVEEVIEEAQKEIDQKDYFPFSVGTKWVYTIQIGKAEPLFYREKRWPLGDGELRSAVRGRFFPLFDSSRKTFGLEMRVKAKATKQGPVLEYPDGVELEIEKDELGIFEGSQQVFWAINNYNRFEVLEVVAYSGDGLGAPSGSWGMPLSEEGYSLAFFFFCERPGIEIGIGRDDEVIDSLLFVGVDTQVPQYRGIPLLHFYRTVKPEKKEEGKDLSYLDKGFTEDRWFARGKGLVRLEQKVEGICSMVWTLKIS